MTKKIIDRNREYLQTKCPSQIIIPNLFINLKNQGPLQINNQKNSSKLKNKKE